MGNCCSGGTEADAAPAETDAGSGANGSAAKRDSVNNSSAGANSAHQHSSRVGGGEEPPKSPSTAGKPSASAPKGKIGAIGPVLQRPMEDVKATYTMGKELGRGQFGVTHLCTHKATGQKYACKTIAKRKLSNKEDIEDVRREVQIMHHLAGQKNVVELKGAFEDKNSVHLVMELCAGGELFDRIIAKGHYTERAAASLMRTIVQIVHTCHSMGVIHRDLKPENFLLLNKDEDSPLKATDFGLSVFYKEGLISS